MEKHTISIIKNIAKNLSDLDESAFPLNDVNTLALHSGLPGLVLFYGELQKNFPNEGWDEIGNKYLTLMVKAIRQQGIPTLSMFSGAAGIGLSAFCLSENFKYYNNLIFKINKMIADQLHVYTDIDISEGVRMQIYDVIEGLSGILNYLLLFKSDCSLRPAIESGVQFLVNLASSEISIQGMYVPGYYVPSKYQFSHLESQIYKNGNFNTSMSHGIAGLLALLCYSYMEGVSVPNHKKAIHNLIDFLMWSRLRDTKRIFWKGQISFEEYVAKRVSQENIVRRDAWCYGNPGICYALALGAKVLKDDEMLSHVKELYRDTMHDIKGIFSPTFCHGYAGLYQITQAMEDLTGHSYEHEKDALKQQILRYYDADNPYGFNNIEMEGEAFKEIETTGLLTGAVGTCLALLSGEVDEFGLWNKAFLL